MDEKIKKYLTNVENISAINFDELCRQLILTSPLEQSIGLVFQIINNGDFFTLRLNKIFKNCSELDESIDYLLVEIGTEDMVIINNLEDKLSIMVNLDRITKRFNLEKSGFSMTLFSDGNKNEPSRPFNLDEMTESLKIMFEGKSSLDELDETYN